MRRAWLRIIMSLTVLVLMGSAMLLAGCSTGGGENGQSCRDVMHVYEYDQYSDTGLVLKANIEGDNHAFISFKEMEAEYIDLEACAANTGTPGPTVQFLNFDSNDQYSLYPLRYEVYYYAIQTVFIDTATEDRPERNCISDREFLRHGFLHHVLELNGADPRENSNHTHPTWTACEALGPKTCNGEYCE